MAKITNEGLTRWGTGCFNPHRNSRRQRVKQQKSPTQVARTWQARRWQKNATDKLLVTNIPKSRDLSQGS